MILINGESKDVLPANDRGLAYGDGLFETIQIDQNRPVLWKRHMQRLQAACELLRMGQIDSDLLLRECLLVSRGQEKGVVKIVITRGSGGRGYRPANESLPRRVISFHAWPEYPGTHVSEGIRLFLCTTPVSTNTRLAGLKTLCRLEQVLATMEWDEPEFSEGLMLDDKGKVIEGTRSNIFLVKDGTLITPGLEASGIKGIMRDVVIELAVKDGISVQERDIDNKELLDADEIFVSNSIIKIWPVREYQEKAFNSRMLTGRIMQLLEQHLSDYE